MPPTPYPLAARHLVTSILVSPQYARKHSTPQKRVAQDLNLPDTCQIMIFLTPCVVFLQQVVFNLACTQERVVPSQLISTNLYLCGSEDLHKLLSLIWDTNSDTRSPIRQVMLKIGNVGWEGRLVGDLSARYKNPLKWLNRVDTKTPNKGGHKEETWLGLSKEIEEKRKL